MRKPWRGFLIAALAALVVGVPLVYSSSRQYHRRNFRVVEDGVLYRSGQLTPAGLAAVIDDYRIKTVISLRAFHSDKDEVESTTLRTERIRFNTWHPEDEDVVRFLKLVSNTNSGPFLIHCLHGADRTGTMIAIHRIAIEGWTKPEAIKEMTTGGFGYHPVWRNLIKYLHELDVEKLKKKAGLTAK